MLYYPCLPFWRERKSIRRPKTYFYAKFCFEEEKGSQLKRCHFVLCFHRFIVFKPKNYVDRHRLWCLRRVYATFVQWVCSHFSSLRMHVHINQILNAAWQLRRWQIYKRVKFRMQLQSNISDDHIECGKNNNLGIIVHQYRQSNIKSSKSFECLNFSHYPKIYFDFLANW